MSMHSGMVVSSGPTPQAAHSAAQVLDQKINKITAHLHNNEEKQDYQKLTHNLTGFQTWSKPICGSTTYNSLLLFYQNNGFISDNWINNFL
jgi:hypothetical protein